MNPGSYTAGLTLLWPPIFTPRVRVPLYADPCAAGFPSPAQDYVEKELDLNELCIRRRASTFFVRASGNSMRDLGLCDGDVMVVDRAERWRRKWRAYGRVHGQKPRLQPRGEY
ncbi:SamA (plasmid) [Pantoea dispersa]|nr:SamA [Pantoea dispersa]